jgi:hypothetical protein
MPGNMLESIKSLLRGWDAMRLLPSQAIFSSDINVFALSDLLIVSFLFIFARGIVAGATGDYAAAVIITVVTTLIFFLVAICVRLWLKGRDADDQTNKTATWLFLYWIICIVIIDLTDVPLVLTGHYTLGYYIFSDFPIMFLGLEVPPGWIDVLRAVLVSLIGWLILLFKTQRQFGPFPTRGAFNSWEFPIYTAVNTVLLLVVVLSPY